MTGNSPKPLQQHDMAPPKTSDYSPAAVQKAVLSLGMTHPATIYPLALGAGSGFVGWLFGLPALYIAAGLGLLTGAGWAVGQVSLLKDKVGHRYLQRLHQRQQAYETYLKQLLQRELAACADIQGAEHLAAQGAAQFSKIQDKLSNIIHLLDLKLNPTELTYGRFQGAAEQVCLSVLDNLKNMLSILKSTASIDGAYIESRLADIAAQKQLTREDERERQTLLERRELKATQLRQVRVLLASNEEALTEMEKISARVAQWQTGGKFAVTDYESAIQRLQELAEATNLG